MTAPAHVRTCYRHPDRAAGITCQRCDRPICPACMQQASVGFHCPECAASGAQREYRGLGALRARPIVTQVLIAINVVAFVAMQVTRTLAPSSTYGRAIAAQTPNRGLFADGALWGPAVPDEPWRLLTGGFLHSNDIPFGILHLGMNMWILWVFGRMLEPALGRTRFLALYFAALFGGALGVVLLDPRSLTIGASGAIFGLFGAAFVVARDRGIDIRQSGLIQLLVLNLVITFGFAGFVSVGGHLGGLAGGALAALVLVEGAKRLGSRGELVAVLVTVGLTLVFAGVSYGLMVQEYR
jgi:membrane associated rhomboid family serine protease